MRTFLLLFSILFLNTSGLSAIHSTPKVDTLFQSGSVAVSSPNSTFQTSKKEKLNRWQRFKNHFSKKKISIKKWLKELKRKAINKTLVGILLIFGVTMFGSVLISLGAAFAFSLLTASATTAAILAGIVGAIGGYFLTDYLYQSIVKEKSPLWLKITAGFFALIPLLVVLAFYTSE